MVVLLLTTSLKPSRNARRRIGKRFSGSNVSSIGYLGTSQQIFMQQFGKTGQEFSAYFAVLAGVMVVLLLTTSLKPSRNARRRIGKRFSGSNVSSKRKAWWIHWLLRYFSANFYAAVWENRARV
jgi:hypothetical protein